MNPENEPSFFEEVQPYIYEKYFDYEVSANAMELLRLYSMIFGAVAIFGMFTISVKEEEKQLWEEVADMDSADEFK